MDGKMTLEQVRDWLIKEGQFRIRVQGKSEHNDNLLKMADAIDAHLTQPAHAVDVTDADVEAAGLAYFEQQWGWLPPRSKAIYRHALRRVLTGYATRAIGSVQADD